MSSRKTKHPRCSYCGLPAELVTGREIYPQRTDLFRKLYWRCKQCRAWVGCHEGTQLPLGRLAGHQLRQAKMAAHAAFDPLWKTGLLSRNAAYASLATELKIKRRDCHIGMFDVDMCDKVVEASLRIRERHDGKTATTAPAGNGQPVGG